jgi:hypothetical protein
MFWGKYYKTGDTLDVPCEQVPMYDNFFVSIEPTQSQERASIEMKMKKKYQNKMMKNTENKDCSAC